MLLGLHWVTYEVHSSPTGTFWHRAFKDICNGSLASEGESSLSHSSHSSLEAAWPRIPHSSPELSILALTVENIYALTFLALMALWSKGRPVSPGVWPTSCVTWKYNFQYKLPIRREMPTGLLSQPCDSFV